MPAVFTKTPRRSAVINVPIALDQVADGLRRLSRSDLLTLELLLDRQAMRTIRQSVQDVKGGRVRPFRA